MRRSRRRLGEDRACRGRGHRRFVAIRSSRLDGEDQRPRAGRSSGRAEVNLDPEVLYGRYEATSGQPIKRRSLREPIRASASACSGAPRAGRRPWRQKGRGVRQVTAVERAGRPASGREKEAGSWPTIWTSVRHHSGGRPGQLVHGPSVTPSEPVRQHAADYGPARTMLLLRTPIPTCGRKSRLESCDAEGPSGCAMRGPPITGRHGHARTHPLHRWCRRRRDWTRTS